MAFVKKAPATGGVKKFVSGAATTAKKAPAGRTKTATARVKPVKITFQAPSDMKPCFIEFSFRTQADGLIGPHFKALRVKGNWTNPNAKRFDMMEYDPTTVAAIISRLAARTFATNALRRLPAHTAFRIVIRAGLRKADGTILSGIKSVARMVKSARTGKGVWKEMVDKTDPVYRKIRSASRFLPGAFVNLQLPQSTPWSKKEDEDTEE